jgi:hypothetical protein
MEVRLSGGPFDGRTVETKELAGVICAYKNMYNVVKSCRPGDLPGTQSMAAYQIRPGIGVAEFLSSL